MVVEWTVGRGRRPQDVRTLWILYARGKPVVKIHIWATGLYNANGIHEPRTTLTTSTTAEDVASVVVTQQTHYATENIQNK